MSNDAPEFAHESTERPATLQEPIYIHLPLTDPEVLAAVCEYPAGPQRIEFVAACVKVGVLSLRAARGVIDGDAIRREGDNLINQLTERLNNYRNQLETNVTNSLQHYFDPSSGLFSTRVERLVKDDGELVSVIQGQVISVQRELTQTFERFIGENSEFLALLAPTESNQLLAAMRNTVNGVMQAEKAAILEQFSLDNPRSALSRLVRDLTKTHGDLTEALHHKMQNVVAEFSLDNEGSALSRLVKRVEHAQESITQEFSLDNAASALSRLRNEMQGQMTGMAEAQTKFHHEVVTLLSSMASRKAAEARSTTHGAEFEMDVGDTLRAIAGPLGDIVEDCGMTTGNIRGSKVGDFVITLPPESAAAGARIVIEAKESSAYSLRTTLDESATARSNRNAGVALFVHSKKTAPAELDMLSKYGNDVVVVWDAEDPTTDIILRSGYLVAKALSVRAAHHDKKEAASFQKIDRAIETLKKQIEGFDEIITAAGTIRNGSEKILNRVRIMNGEIEKQVEILGEHIAAVKDDDREAKALE